jgi:hypothetical protein
MTIKNPEKHTHNDSTYIVDVKMELRATEYKDVNWTELV